MVMTFNEFMEIIQFAALLFYRGFWTLDQAKIFESGGIQVSLLDIMLGFLVVGLVVDYALRYLEGD